MAESPRRPVSVIGVVADAGEPKSTEDSSVPRTGDPIEGSLTVLTERRCRSTHPDEGPESGRSSRHAEQHSVGVDGSTDDPGDAAVRYVVNTPRRQSKHRSVSSRSRCQCASVSQGERRRRHASSSPSGDGSGREQSPLAIPLPDEGSGHGAPHRLPKQGYRSTEGSREVTRGHGLQHGQEFGAAPPVIRESMSEESDGDEESGELSGEVRSILNTRTGVQRGICSGNSHGGTATRQRYDDPSEFRAGEGRESSARGMEEPMASGRRPHHILQSRAP